MSLLTENFIAGEAALSRAKWSEAKACFEAALLEKNSPETRDGLGLALWWLNDVSGAHEQRTLAYLGYKANGNLPKAARLAAWLAREQVFLQANVSAMKGWFARAQRLLGEIEPCAEIGWVKIYRASMTASPEGQAQAARESIEIARQHADPDLGAFSLAILGSALVSLAKVNDGMEAIDEASRRKRCWCVGTV